ncbi:MAG TPA: hypothetical protein VGD27_02415, partial [Longimicrobiales bacterium]
PAPMTAERAQSTASIIGLSLPLGVTLMAGVAWFVGGAAPRSEPEFARILIYAWIALTAVTGMTSLFFWRSRVEPLISGHEPLPAARMNELMTGLIITWALIEPASLFGIIIYLLHGTLWVAITALLLSWGVALATRPQLEWFQRFRG